MLRGVVFLCGYGWVESGIDEGMNMNIKKVDFI